MQLKEEKRRDFRSCFNKGRVKRAAVQWCQLRKRRKIGGGGLGTTAIASSMIRHPRTQDPWLLLLRLSILSYAFFLPPRTSEIKRYFQLCIFNSEAFFFSQREILYGCYLLELVTSLELRFQKKVLVLVAQSCLILCNLSACSPPGSSVYGILRQE